MLRKLLGIFIVFSVVLTLSACGDSSDGANSNDSGSKDADTKNESAEGVVAQEEFDLMYSDPLSYKDYEVEFTGRVFVEPEKDSEGTYLQVYAKPEEYEQNVLVAYPDSSFEVETDDYVKITGIVRDQYEGENLLGGTVVAPVIEATSIEVVDYITAVSPTIKTVDVQQEIDQSGFVVTLQKIEIAENQTRLYVKVSNKSNDPISYFSSSTKLVVENEQLESEYLSDDTGLPGVQSDILPGVESEGVIVFPAIDSNTTTLKFYSEGYSENYEIDIEPFVFDVTIE